MTSTHTEWYLSGEELVSCNCDWGCPCQFNAPPTHGFCDSWLTCRIDEGWYGEIKLDGLTFAAMTWFPGALHEGNGTAQFVINSEASARQRNSLEAILSGKEGGLFFEIFSALCPNVMEPIYAPIRFASNRETRIAVVEIPGVAHSAVEPIRNPVTGDWVRAKIVQPEGFEYREAEMGNTIRVQVIVDSKLRMDYRNSYAQLNRFDWTNT